ncbi:MAG: helix-turn-helix transcriptional regulator [Myxococcales bacterium]|nr:helix-turn-helix transcriptional regulator [Myxococcales bacterium]
MTTPISTTRQRQRQDLGRSLRAARAFARGKQAAAAAACGVTRNTLGLWERGEREPSAVDLLALATLYGVSLDALCGRAPLAPG